MGDIILLVIVVVGLGVPAAVLAQKVQDARRHRAHAMSDCAKNTNCTLIVDGSSAGVNVNAGGSKKQ